MADQIPTLEETVPVPQPNLAPPPAPEASPAPEQLPALEDTTPVAEAATAPSGQQPPALEDTTPVSSPAPSAAGKPREFTGRDIDEIAGRHGVDSTWLRGMANYFDARYVPENLNDVGTQGKEVLKRTAGYMGELLPVSPAGLYKKLGDLTPEQRRALDDLQHEVEEREGLGEKALKLGGSLALPIGFASKVAPAYRLAAGALEGLSMGAAGAYAHSKEGDEAKDTIFGGALGLVLGFGGGLAAEKIGGALAARSAKARQATEEAMADVEREASERFAAKAPEEQALKETVLGSREARAAVRAGDVEALSATVPQEQLEKIAGLVDHEEGSVAERAMEAMRSPVEDLDKAARRRTASVTEYAEKEGPEALSDLWDRTRQGSYLKQRLTEDAERLAQERPDPIRKVLGYLADARYVYGAADERLGTRLVPALDEVSKGLNRFSDELASAALQQRPLNSALLKAEKANPSFSLFDALEGRYTPQSPLEEDVTRMWREAFEARRQRADQLGVKIGKLEGYVPHLMVDPLEAARRIDQRIPDRSDEALTALLSSETPTDKDTLRGLSLFSGTEPTTPAELRTALRSLDAPGVSGAALGTRARFGEAREGELPDFLMEKDVPKLMARWTANTYRHGYLRGPLQELAARAEAIKDQAPEVASYVERHIRDLSGSRPGTIAEANGRYVSRAQMALTRAADQADQAGKPIKAGALRLATKLPDVMSGVAQNMNVYALGLRPTTGLKILLQPYSYSLPTLGPAATQDFALATADAMKSMVTLNMKRAFQEVVDRGLSPQKLPLEAGRWISDGLDRSPVSRWAANAKEWLNTLALWQYRNSHVMARVVSLNASKRIVGRMFEDPRVAEQMISAVQREEPGYARAISDAFQRGDKERTTDLFASYVNGATQFNFDRAGMSEYGRTMGSLFSTFTKVPLTVLGDFAKSADRIDRSGKLSPELMRLSMKYLAPMLSFYGLEKAVQASGVRENPIANAALPKNFAAVPPLEATGKLTEFSPLAAPLPHAVSELYKVAASGDEEKARKALNDMLAPALPGSAWLRFFVSDLPRYGGENTRSNPLEELEDRYSP